MLQCSLVVPVFNEEEHIVDFCESLISLKDDFSEVIFVDGGSRDKTVSLLESYKDRLNLKVMIQENSLPGLGRNIGVKAATYDIIIFIDMGIRPDKDWIKNLKKEYQKSELPFVWGSCIFRGTNFWSKILAALSVGQDIKHEYVIPASLFHKSVFEEIGYFDGTLRAGEDILFRKNIFSKYGRVGSSLDAIIYYETFPKNPIESFLKWYKYAIHCAKGNVSFKQEMAYYLFLFIQIILVLTKVNLFYLFILMYFLLRGIVDPMRRSKNLYWWNGNFFAVLVTPVFSYFLDLSKSLGFLMGRLGLYESR